MDTTGRQRLLPVFCKKIAKPAFFMSPFRRNWDCNSRRIFLILSESERMVIVMAKAKSKHRGRKAVVFLLIAAVLAAIGITLWLTLSPQPEQTAMELVQEEDPALPPGTVNYIVSGGLDLTQGRSLPIYSFSPPEGYTHSVNAQETANRYSDSYEDQYRSPDGGTLTFTQQAAYFNWSCSGSADAFREMQFGGTNVICRLEEGASSAFWLEGESILQLSADWAMDENQLLELVSRVDSSNIRQPIYTPFSFEEGYCRQETVNGATQTLRQNYRVVGNPQLPETPDYLVYAQPPQGFVYSEPSSETNNAQGFQTVCYYSTSSDDAGRANVLIVTNSSQRREIFTHLTDEELADPDLVQEVTVNGRPGLYCFSGNQAELVWLEEDMIVSLSYTVYVGSGSSQRMVELAEQLTRSSGQAQQ